MVKAEGPFYDYLSPLLRSQTVKFDNKRDIRMTHSLTIFASRIYPYLYKCINGFLAEKILIFISIFLVSFLAKNFYYFSYLKKIFKNSMTNFSVSLRVPPLPWAICYFLFIIMILFWQENVCFLTKTLCLEKYVGQ